MRALALLRPLGRRGLPLVNSRCGALVQAPARGAAAAAAAGGGGGRASCPAATGARIRRRGPGPPAEVGGWLEAALAPDAPLERRLEAVQALRDLISEPPLANAAEDALHRVLQEASGDSAGRLREVTEEALWSAWHRSGDEEVDATLRQGTALMDKEELDGAVRLFSEVILRLPDYAEAWNKRATAYYMLQDYESSIADCKEVLKLKPRHFGCLAGLGMCYQALDKRREAVEFFRKALKVHPGLQGPQRLIETMELHEVINERLRPHIVRVAQSLSEGSSSTAACVTPELSCDWDMHRVVPAGEVRQTYFVRVRVRNCASEPSELRSLARFYALRFPCGRIFPLTRLTEGPASFSLGPREEHRFCWHLALRRELRDAAGGLLLLEAGAAGARAPAEERLVSADLDLRVPAEVSPDEVERLRLGYDYTGTLNLEHLDLGSAPQPE